MAESAKVKGTKKVQKVKSNVSHTMSACTICDENINERSKTNVGDDAVLCDGKCQSWLHRRCAGLSRVRFRIVTDSIASFIAHNVKLKPTLL